MQLVEDHNDAKYQIKAFDRGRIQINETTYHHSLIISSTTLITDWEPSAFAELTADVFAPIFSLAPHLVILGTGNQFALPKPAVLAPFYERKIGIECMDSKAACRTFMALSAENRNVVAAILIE